MIGSTFAGTSAWSTAADLFAIHVNSIDYSDPTKNVAGAGIPHSTIALNLTLAGNSTLNFDIIDKTGTITVPLFCNVDVWDGNATMCYMGPTAGGSFAVNVGPYAVGVPNNYLFAGVVTAVEAEAAYGPGQIIHVSCVDYGLLLDRSYVISPGFNIGGTATVAQLLANIDGAIPGDIDVHGAAEIDSGGTGSVAASAGTVRSILDQTVEFVAAQFAVAPSIIVQPWRALASRNGYDFQYVFGPSGGSGEKFLRRRVSTSDKGYAQVVTETPGIISYWRLDDGSSWGSTVAADVVGLSVSATSTAFALWTLSGGNPGTYTASPTLGVAGPMSGDPGTGVTFASASSQYVTVPNPASKSLDLGDTISFVFWAKRSSAGTHGILNKGTGYLQVTWNSDGTVSAAKAGTADFLKSTGTSASDGNWHHFIVTKSGGTAAIYIDGANAGGTYSAQTLVNTSSALELARQSGATNYFNGTLAQCAIFSTALSVDQAQALWNARTGILGNVHPESIRYALDGSSTESAVASNTSFVYSDTVFGTGTLQAQSFNRALSTGAVPANQTVSSYLLDRGTRQAVTFDSTGKEAWRPGTNVNVQYAPIGIPSPIDFTVTDVSVRFIAGDGTRRSTVTASGSASSGGQRSALRAIQQRLTSGNL